MMDGHHQGQCVMVVKYLADTLCYRGGEWLTKAQGAKQPSVAERRRGKV